jgi:virginiamycin B lyase
VTEYPLPSGTYPQGITTGPDGNLWVADGSNVIFKVTTAGTYTAYTVPTSGSYPSAIVTGPDGCMWFTEALGGKIGTICP